MLALNIHQQLRHGGRYRDVESRHRFVGDDHGGVAGECARDADTLLLPARELARASDVEVARKLDDVQQLQHPLLNLRLVRLDAELLDDPPDLGPDGVAWIEGVETGFWNTIWSEPICRGERSRTAIFEISLPSWRMLPSVAVSSPMSTFAKVDFPAAGLADNGDRLPAPGVEGDLFRSPWTYITLLPATSALIERSCTS